MFNSLQKPFINGIVKSCYSGTTFVPFVEKKNEAFMRLNNFLEVKLINWTQKKNYFEGAGILHPVEHKKLWPPTLYPRRNEHMKQYRVPKEGCQQNRAKTSVPQVLLTQGAELNGCEKMSEVCARRSGRRQSGC